MMTLPFWMGSRPLMQRSMVDLPEPDGPMTTTTSFFTTVRSTPCSTLSWSKDLCTPMSSIMALKHLTSLGQLRGDVGVEEFHLASVMPAAVSARLALSAPVLHRAATRIRGMVKRT